MNDDRADDGLRRAFDAIARQRETRGDRAVVPLDEIVALVERRGSESSRLRILDAVMRDPASRRDFELLRSLGTNETAPARRFTRPYVALAAAAVLALVALPLVWRPLARQGDPMRDGVATMRLVAPPLEAAPRDARTFVWHANPDAQHYRLELLSADGEPLFTTRTTDTLVTLPDDVHLSPNEGYRWWVTSEFADGTQRRSAFRRLLVRATPE